VLKDLTEKDEKLEEELAIEKAKANELVTVIRKLNEKEVRELITHKSICKDNYTIHAKHVIIERKFLKAFEKEKEFCSLANSDLGIRICTVTNEKIMNSYYSREIINRIQKQRKASGIKIVDDIMIVYQLEESSIILKEVCTNWKDFIEKTIRVKFETSPAEGYKEDSTESFTIENEKIVINIYKK
jgi:hypothetical protein